ncbi:hypothetical protein CFIICLFH_5056 [Methylobacterium goesingense]|nr:hypothetical protein CFIICLFH_5056 [Methylobacterium goesingense]
MVVTANPGEPYFAHAMKVCADPDFRAIAVISLDVRLSLDDLAAAGVREADLVIEPLFRRAAELGHAEAHHYDPERAKPRTQKNFSSSKFKFREFK